MMAMLVLALVTLAGARALYRKATLHLRLGRLPEALLASTSEEAAAQPVIQGALRQIDGTVYILRMEADEADAVAELLKKAAKRAREGKGEL